MYGYIIRRLWQMIPTLLGVILLVFILFNFVGGDPAYVLAGKISSAEQIENIRRQLGVDQPYYVQLWIFVKQILTADFGASWSTNESVSHILATRLGPSLTVLIPLLILVTLIARRQALETKNAVLAVQNDLLSGVEVFRHERWNAEADIDVASGSNVPRGQLRDAVAAQFLACGHLRHPSVRRG